MDVKKGVDTPVYPYKFKLLIKKLLKQALRFARLHEVSPFRFQFSVYLVCLTTLNLVAAWVDEEYACVLIVALQLHEDVVERRAVRY